MSGHAFWGTDPSGYCNCDDCEAPDTEDPYDEPIWIQGHSHSEPVCAWPDCETYLTRPQMAILRKGRER